MSCVHLVFCAPRVPVSARRGDEGPYPFLRAGRGGVRCDAYLFLRFAPVGGRWSFVGGRCGAEMGTHPVERGGRLARADGFTLERTDLWSET